MFRTNLFIGAALVASLAAALPAAAADPAPEDLDVRIGQLIVKLGSPHFLVRDRAQQELVQIGLPAFDQLFEAQQHDDIEIALRARYLVRKLRVTWARDDDPQEVRRLLRNYDEISRDERESRMRQLAALDDRLGVDSLCRLVRYENDERLSKRAALLVLNMPLPDEAARPALAKLLGRQMAVSKRPATAWLRAYAQTLTDAEKSLATWDVLTRDEHQLFIRQTQPDEHTNREIVRDLLRWQVALLDRLGKQEQAVAAMRRTVELIDNTRQDLIETVEWLMQRSAWPVVDEIATRYADRFARDATLLYRLAETRLKQGQKEPAETTAAKARSVEGEDPSQHVLQGFQLQERGLFDWATREYRSAIDLGPAGSIHDLRARFLMSEMQHDQEQSLAAAKTLQGAVDAMDKEEAVVQVVEQRLGRDPKAIRSRMHYFYSVDHAAKGERAEQIKQLDKAVDADPTDADALIARYRVKEPTPEFHKRTVELIRSAADSFQAKAAELERQIEPQNDQPTREYIERELATDLNQFAWLVGNTEGNYEAAVQASHRSLVLRPETGGYYDTLGRCYYAKGDLANAVKYQSLAVKLEPHTSAIRRQLELFKKEAEKRSK